MSAPHPFSLCQIDPVAGDIDGNIERIIAAYDNAAEHGAMLAIFPECSIIGYPVEDLVLHATFRTKAMAAVQRLAAYTAHTDCAMLVGGIWADEGMCYNSAFLLDNGVIHSTYYKHILPNDSVFDEKRVFAHGPLADIIVWRDIRLAIMICADLWATDQTVARHYSALSPDAVVVLNASPFIHDKQLIRHRLAKECALICNAPLYYVNLTGGQDELIFDGGSFAVSAAGDIMFHLPFFTVTSQASMTPYIQPDPLSLLYSAMMEGLRAYVAKNGFSDVLLGLSGGIDSALTAVIAADALGADHVHTVMLSSPYTADISLNDAQQLADALGTRYDSLAIDSAMQAIDNTLAPLSPSVPNALALENIQSRLRGLTLMAISNSSGALLVTTGNKSEMATGYATLYGDMCGAFSVLKDVYKTDVFALSRWRNINVPHNSACAVSSPMPERIITRPPSAELRADQRDDDSLPPYEVLDSILKLLIEERKGLDAIIEQGFESDIVRHIHSLLQRSEYKRRQAPPGVKLTSISFGRDRRLPLTNRYNGN